MKKKNENLLVPQCLSNLVPMKRNAFTLAEVLITLGIIGVVAAITIPTLITNNQEKSFDSSATVFERKLGEALKVMNSQMTLAGHESTESFVDELSKHFKITRVCDNDELLNCFEEQVFWGSGTTTPEAVDMSAIKTSKNFGQTDWQETNVVGVQFANGTNALIAYNKDATQDPYSNEIIALSGSSNGKSGSVSLGTTALAILYDTNGAKAPNQSAKDLRSINISKLGKNCFAEANGVCLSMAGFAPTPVSKAECEAMMSTHGIKSCNSEPDYWAGAVKQCGGVNKMPNASQLAQIANYIYGTTEIGPETYKNKITMNTTKTSSLGLPSSGEFYIWSNIENSSGNAERRNFSPTYSSWGGSPRTSSRLAICVE